MGGWVGIPCECMCGGRSDHRLIIKEEDIPLSRLSIHQWTWKIEYFSSIFVSLISFTPTSLRRKPPCLQSLCPSTVSAVSVCFLKKQSAMLCLSGFAHRGCPGIWMIPPQTILKKCLNWKCGYFRKLPVKNYFPFPDIMNCLGEWRTPATHFYSQFSPPGIYINPTSSQTTPNMAKYESNPKRWNKTKIHRAA